MGSPQPRKHIVVVGGGTGAPRLLAALRAPFPDATKTVIVPVSDRGRSSGVVRDALGVPAPGDVRQALTTLADETIPWSSILETRLAAAGHPDLDGVAVGNLVLGALAAERGMTEAARRVGELLGIVEEVVPATDAIVDLEATLADGSVVSDELSVRALGKPPIRRLRVVGDDARVSEVARAALERAGAVIIGPGSLWTSVGAVLALDGVSSVLSASSATLVFVCNTTSQPGQTDGLSVKEHVKIVADLAGRVPDVVILNSGTVPADEAAELEKEGLHPLTANHSTIAAIEAAGSHVVVGDFIHAAEKPALWNKLHTLYHDMDRVASVLSEQLGPNGAHGQRTTNNE